jgi:hypothetical protein
MLRAARRPFIVGWPFEATAVKLEGRHKRIERPCRRAARESKRAEGSLAQVEHRARRAALASPGDCRGATPSAANEIVVTALRRESTAANGRVTGWPGQRRHPAAACGSPYSTTPVSRPACGPQCATTLRVVTTARRAVPHSAVQARRLTDVPIGPWRCQWWDKSPSGFCVECELPDVTS